MKISLPPKLPGYMLKVTPKCVLPILSINIVNMYTTVGKVLLLTHKSNTHICREDRKQHENIRKIPELQTIVTSILRTHHLENVGKNISRKSLNKLVALYQLSNGHSSPRAQQHCEYRSSRGPGSPSQWEPSKFKDWESSQIAIAAKDMKKQKQPIRPGHGV